MLVTSDAGEHEFWPKLHSSDGEDPGDSGATQFTLYSRSGSYLRLRKDVATGIHEVDFPSGETRRFAANTWTSQNTDYRVVQIRDQYASGGNFLNVVTVEYDNPANTMKLTDPYERVQTVNFHFKTYDGAPVRMVDSVVLTAFGTASATYDFRYEGETGEPPPTAQRRDCRDGDGSTPDLLEASLLTSIVLPDGSRWQARYKNEAGDFPCARGQIASLTYPTGGRIEYEYSRDLMPTPDGCDEANTIGSDVLTVHERRFIDPVANTPTGSWLYGYTLSPAPETPETCHPDGLPATPSEQLTVRVTAPSSDYTEYFFSVWPSLQDSPAGFKRRDYGLPFTRGADPLDPEDDPVAGRNLSWRTFDCAPGPCTKVRSEYVVYEDDLSVVTPTANPFFFTQQNRRLAIMRTIYHDDLEQGTPVFSDTVSTDFDGLSHYRHHLSTGNYFPTESSSTSHTQFNDDRGTYPGSFDQLLPSEAWILGTFDYTEVSEEHNGQAGIQNTEISRRDFVFNPANGFLECTRTYKLGTATSVNDVLVLFTNDPVDPRGNTSRERHFGGDFAPLGGSSTCASPPATAEYRLDHTYTRGVRDSSAYSGAGFLSLDLTIDERTGLPSSARDPAGIETLFTYDTSGRMTRAEPQAFGTPALPQDGWTRVLYGTTTTPFSVETRRCGLNTTDCNSAILTSDSVFFDGFGRVYREKRLRAAGGSSRRVTLYNSMGQPRRVSSWIADVTNPTDEETIVASVYSGYDPFGRPDGVTLPDGKFVDYEFDGVRWAGTTSTVATAIGGSEVNSVRWEGYDRQGRLRQVLEETRAGSPPNSFAPTDYKYDEGGRLIEVCQNRTGSPTSPNCGQKRSFSYDNRGFLSSETHPEKGNLETGNGTVTYSLNDSRGHARQRDDGVAGLSRRLKFTFDAAERLTFVRTNGDVALKTFTYDSAPGAGDGRLATASRLNQRPAPFSDSVVVTESYAYEGRQGRASSRTTQVTVNGVNDHCWLLGTKWNLLGQQGQVDYPLGYAGNCATGTHETFPRSVVFDQTNGFLTSIDEGVTSAVSWSPSITYHPNFLTDDVEHANGVIDHQEIATHAMQRPLAISISGVVDDPTPWSTGNYAFDGAGNVKSLGGTVDRFRYDKVSRLVEADLTSLAPTSKQVYAFDAYGNITQITTTIGGTPLPAEPFPVQLDANGDPNNRLDVATYDAGGNLLVWNGNGYSFDLLNTMTSLNTGSEIWGYAYTADDERILATKSDGSRKIWTLRDLGARLIRRMEVAPPGLLPLEGDGWTKAPNGFACGQPGDPCIFKDGFESGNTSAWISPNLRINDYIWRGDKLFASSGTAGAFRHFALDHLGTVRVVTNELAEVVAEHTYFPFGREASATTQDAEPLKFTGHERDLQSTASSTADDLDYLHRRFANPLTARFLSTDPVLSLARAIEQPQAWNRYSYVIGNPLTYVDPTGEVFVLAGCGGVDAAKCSASTDLLKQALGDTFSEVRINSDGFVALAKGVSGSAFAALGDFQRGLLNLIGDKSTFTLHTGSSPEATAGGGGQTLAVRGGGANIYVDPTMFPRQTGDVQGNASTTFVHELGHALGTLFPQHYNSLSQKLGMSLLTQSGEAYAVTFENRYRASIGADIRHAYFNGNVQDVRIDTKISLFP